MLGSPDDYLPAGLPPLDKGFINNPFHAFLLTPIPKPSSLVLAACALATLVFFARRRRSVA